MANLDLTFIFEDGCLNDCDIEVARDKNTRTQVKKRER